MCTAYLRGPSDLRALQLVLGSQLRRDTNKQKNGDQGTLKVSEHLVNRTLIEKVDTAFRKRTCQKVITAGFRHLKESHGEDELDYSIVFQGAEPGPMNGVTGKWILTPCRRDLKTS